MNKPHMFEDMLDKEPVAEQGIMDTKQELNSWEEEIKQSFFQWTRRQHLSRQENEKLAKWWIENIKSLISQAKSEGIAEENARVAKLVEHQFYGANDPKVIDIISAITQKE